jgi:hypothetical protein
MIFIIGGREQGKTAYAMKLWEKRTLERRKTKDLSTVLNRSKNPEACRVTARIADGRNGRTDDRAGGSDHAF